MAAVHYRLEPESIFTGQVECVVVRRHYLLNGAAVLGGFQTQRRLADLVLEHHRRVLLCDELPHAGRVKPLVLVAIVYIDVALGLALVLIVGGVHRKQLRLRDFMECSLQVEHPVPNRTCILLSHVLQIDVWTLGVHLEPHLALTIRAKPASLVRTGCYSL